MQQPLTILYLKSGNSKIYDLWKNMTADLYFELAKNHEFLIITDQIVYKFLWNSDEGGFVVPRFPFCLKPNNPEFIPKFSKLYDGNIKSWEEIVALMDDTCTTEIIIRDEIPTQDILKLFDTCEFLSYVNYPKTITALENLKVVETKQTSSFMFSDSRKFSIIGEEEWYDVDILGTIFGQEITARITELFRVS